LLLQYLRKLSLARTQRTSLTGTNWTHTGNATSFNLVSMSPMPGMLIGVDSTTVWNSIDGTNWISRATPNPGFQLNSVTFGHGLAVVVGATSAGKGYILSSGEIPAIDDPSLALDLYPGLAVSGAIGRTYRIESASTADASDWQSAGQITLTKSPQVWFDENAATAGLRHARASA